MHLQSTLCLNAVITPGTLLNVEMQNIKNSKGWDNFVDADLFFKCL